MIPARRRDEVGGNAAAEVAYQGRKKMPELRCERLGLGMRAKRCVFEADKDYRGNFTTRAPQVSSTQLHKEQANEVLHYSLPSQLSLLWPPELMGDRSPLSEICPTAVAIDKDKNSQHAVKWAVDHLINARIIVLIHVRSKSSKTEAGLETTRDQADEEVNQLFLPYRGFSARKGIQLKEVVLEGADISKAIVDYINANSIQNIVVGASNRSIMKKLRSFDVPSSLMKSAPDFCAVYVLSKGKTTSIRAARNSTPSVIPPRQLSITASSVSLPDQEDSIRQVPMNRQNISDFITG
ncbi:hypothetical protein M5K25_024390 [Dendrobium thyrsiflorum]|uniref:RING-type E3 ubiquitin transferase n=1 Tax=Dendrobium thyrsiflorum TaxID=117978 RepID=A0ABD0U211_DENTH